MIDEQPEALRQVPQLLAGGDVVSAIHARRYLDGATTNTLINGYGPTENTTFTCCHAMTDSESISDNVPIGRPISNTQVYVCGPDLNLLPVGVPGELLISGDGLARGYFNQANLTGEKFIPDPFSAIDGGRVYKSGDRVTFLDKGLLRFEGRFDRQTKLRGFRIEIEGIENLLRAHTSIKEAACKVFEDAAGEKQLVAYVAFTYGSGFNSEEAVKSYLRERVPDYMAPSTVVVMAELPLTRNGKVDRSALPLPGLRHRSVRYVAPRTITEETVARLWSELLGVAQVGAHDNFFELGGHSLTASRAVSKICEALGVEAPLRTLFEAPTVEEFSARLDSYRQYAPSSIGLPALVPVAIDEYRAIAGEGSIELSEALKERILGSE